MNPAQSKRPNVLWLMSDQHNANCTGYRNHPNVKTPNLDRLAERGVDFTHAFANNPICSPSRICFLTGQYVHTHGMYGNEHAEYPTPNPDTMAAVFRKYGYQTGLFGKAHLTRRWVDDGFETYRYTDLCDAESSDPTTAHYFKYLVDRGLADEYGEGTPRRDQRGSMDGSIPAQLPYEHSIERFTGNETLKFLQERDESRPFFIQMSFQRPHAPITPAKEHFDMYDPKDIVLPDNAFDFLENRFAGKPEWMRERLAKGNYPLADPNPDRLKRCLASYYALISVIDMEIGRVLDKLEEMGELENTVIVYVADHGDFAGEHGLFHKNFGIYDSIQRIPFLLSWPGGPRGIQCDAIVESVDLYPTLCELCHIPMPDGREGESVIPQFTEGASGKAQTKDAAYCEWFWLGRKVSAIRTHDFRLVFYGDPYGGELYDHRSDPGETRNLWENPDYAGIRTRLTEQLFTFTLRHMDSTNTSKDNGYSERYKYSATKLVHKGRKYWSRLKKAYEE